MGLATRRMAVIVLLFATALLTGQDRNSEFFFIQLADTQFGMFSSDQNFQQETANYEFVVANIRVSTHHE